MLPPSAKVGEFPWQPGSWCLDTVKDALQWSCEPDSPQHPLPIAAHPEHLSHRSLPFHLLDANAGLDFHGGAGGRKAWGGMRSGNP